ncbi:hypothetical protein HPP92_015415 [Vanilla planifolia]|uniref:Uncharacterized protein n=1 Tax=Vanilla planifolia TaxID=51239 RepID=A0A835UTN5_VANPL|nr:hypothetical protein HPP92_015415 [Vanilla planifolia]
MLCSMPAVRSSHGWLERLRAARGFHVSSDLDLDHFLLSSSDPNPTHAPSDRKDSALPSLKSPQISERHPRPVGRSAAEEKDQRLFDLMSNVLSELFVMGEPWESGLDKKSSRKQLKPRACVPSASSSVGNSVAHVKKVRTNGVRSRGMGQVRDLDMSAYSRTEATVIDTSSPGWKSQKLLFRKGMVWKVKERKVWTVCTKKRKFGLVEKLIVDKERLRSEADLKGQRKETFASQDEGLPRNVDLENAIKSDDQIPRRPKFSRSPRASYYKKQEKLLVKA